MFQINDFVYYGSGGICQVDDVCTEPFEGAPADVRYYVLHTVSEPRQTIWNPVLNDRVLMRAVMTPDEIDDLLCTAGELEIFSAPNAKLLREQYIGAIKSGLPTEWARVLRTYRERCRLERIGQARVTDAEHNFFDAARKCLAAELSLVLHITEREAGTRIDTVFCDSPILQA